MAIETVCQTPGAHYKITVDRGVIEATVRPPFFFNLSEAEAQRLEANIHNALELVLAPYFLGEVQDDGAVQYDHDKYLSPETIKRLQEIREGSPPLCWSRSSDRAAIRRQRFIDQT